MGPQLKPQPRRTGRTTQRTDSQTLLQHVTTPQCTPVTKVCPTPGKQNAE